MDDMQDTEIHYQDGCTIPTYYENGRAVNAFALCPDGSYYTEEFYSDGMVKSFQRHNIDGQIITIHYYSNGRTEFLRTDFPDGNYELTLYAEDGLSLSFTNNFGDESYTTYHENGNVASLESYLADGNIMKFTYDAEGRETYHYWRNATGESAEYIYNDDFSYTATWYKSNGQVDYINHVNSGGILTGGVDRYGRTYTVDRHGQAVYDEE